MAKHSGQRKAHSISVTITTRQRETVARPDAQWSADTTALVAQQLLDTSVAQDAETRSSLATRHATTATLLLQMDAVRSVNQRSDGFAQPSRAVGLIARKPAETVSKPHQKDAMMETRQRATAAVEGAQWNADTTALHHNPTYAGQAAETRSSLATRHATTATA